LKNEWAERKYNLKTFNIEREKRHLTISEGGLGLSVLG
jgi:hypothetical protein